MHKPPDVELQNRLKKIKCLLLDVDGVLTDCRVFLDDSGEWRRTYSIRDGYGIVRLREQGYQTGVVTASKAKDVKARVEALKMDYFFEGQFDKQTAVESLLQKTSMSWDEVAYMGDDTFDIPVLSKVGFSATVSDAIDEVFSHVQYIAKRPAGNGAVREVCELIIKYGAFCKNDNSQTLEKNLVGRG